MDGTIAQVMMFAGNFAPRNWAFCQGQLLPISQYTAVFSILGTMYGGDGRTTFALPDLRGRTPIGHGNGPGLTNRSIGQKGGEEDVTLTQPQMPIHNHTAQASGGSLTVQDTDPNQGNPQSNSYIARPASNQGVSTILYTSSTGSEVQINGGGTPQVTVNNAGGSQPHNNMQPFLAIPYVICLQGVFPSRN